MTSNKALTVVFIVICSSCRDSDVVSGTTPTSLNRAEVEPPGANCPAGGVGMFAGVDTNKDGTLGDDEVDSFAYACNGTDGETGNVGQGGAPALSSSAPELPGTNCPDGGSAISVGVDDNLDGILGSDEIDGIVYICDGADGASGADGADGAPGAGGAPGTPGSPGQAGQPGQPGQAGQPGQPGQPGQAGADGDDGAPGADGDDGAPGANGQPGPAALTRSAVELPGANCANGGTALSVGIDDNADGLLADGEVDAVVYACTGATGATGEAGIDGDDGATSLLRLDEELAGANCAAGGVAANAGIDDDADGLLDDNEIDSTAFICNAPAAADPESASFVITDTNLTSRLLRVDVVGGVALPPTTIISSGIDQPREIDADSVTGDIFWIDLGSARLMRSAVDGTNPIQIAAVSTNNDGVSVDDVGRRVFWTQDTRVRSATLDGADIRDVATGSVPVGVFVDAASDRVFWSDVGTGLIEVSTRAGAGRITVASGIGEVHGFDFDNATNTLWFCESTSGTIKSVAAGGGTPVVEISGRTSPTDLTIDFSNGFIYFTQSGAAPGLFRANIDGTNIRSLSTSLGTSFGLVAVP